MTEQDEHCKHAGTLSGPAKIAYMRENDLTGEQVWRYGQTHKDTKKTRSRTTKARLAALMAQGGACALCGDASTTRYCLDKSGKAVCNSCNLFLTRYRKLRAGGVECSDMEEFIE